MSMPVNILRRATPWCPVGRWRLKLAEWAAQRITPTDGLAVYSRIHGRLRFELDLGHPDERLMYTGAYEPQIVGLIRRLLKTGDTFVDAGTNIGYLSLLASLRVGASGRVYSFEPQPEAIQRLRRNIALNAIQNIEVVEKGCWHEPGQATLHLFDDADSGIGEMSMSTHDDRHSVQEVRIETDRIDRVVRGPVRLIKLDIEGAELNALRGTRDLLKHEQPPHLIVELNTRTAASFGYEPADILDWLIEVQPRYRVYRIRASKIRPTTREEMVGLLTREPGKHRNVWLSPDLP